MEHFSGVCLCGAVGIRASGPPSRVGICHCTDCRRHHGAMFFAAAVFPAGAVTIRGAPQSYAGRFFCPTCGSSVFARSAEEVEIHLGVLEGDHGLQPSYELWTSRRAGWLPPFPGMTRYPGNRDAPQTRQGG